MVKRTCGEVFREPIIVGRGPLTTALDFSMEFLVPWKECTDPSHCVDELYRELPPGHQIRGVDVKCIGFRQDCDDFLFSLLDGSGRLAVVHLTFSVETDPKWPETELFSSIEEFVQIRMLPDNEDWLS